jgi:dihydroneopterin aldolase
MASKVKKSDLDGLDVIRIKDMVFQARHGCSSAEREIGALFKVSVELYLDTRPAAGNDNLEATADVGKVYETVLEIVTGEPKNLLETIAENTAEALLQKFNIEAVRVCFHKDRVPLPGPSAGYEIEIFRQ